MKEQVLKIIEQLQYEISLLEQSEEDLTGVTIRTEELKELVKNLTIPIFYKNSKHFIIKSVCPFCYSKETTNIDNVLVECNKCGIQWAD